MVGRVRAAVACCVVAGALAAGGTARAATGDVKEFVAPSGPYGIIAGPDGALWFTEPTPGRIGRITTAGTVTEPGTTGSGTGPQSIAAGPDGNLWVTLNTVGRIARVTTAGA